MRMILRIVTALLVAVSLACSSGGKEDPILVLSSEEALERGKVLLEEEKFRQARDYLTHAFEVDPNSVGGREALLLSADAYYLDGGLDNYVRAEAKYRDFQNRFPTSQQAAYVQYQIASALSKRIKAPDRDQTNSRKAVEEYTAVIELYPTSQYVAEARAAIVEVRQTLAAHEMMVGHFYYRYGNLDGATTRLEFLLEEFPDYKETDRALYFLGMTYWKTERVDESVETFERLRTEFPDSRYVRKIPELS